MKKLQNMDDDEFMEAWTAQGTKVQAEKDKLREFKQEHNRRVLAAEAERRLSGLSDDEKAALAQVIEAQGIESEEAVNGNG